LKKEQQDKGEKPRTRCNAAVNRLIDCGDLSAGDASDSLEYDARLVSAVRNFQQRMGLESDGVLGRARLQS
jgi:murein L,D-transpeptidase YcbB/YkuD